jgi:hypothetical protein
MPFLKSFHLKSKSSLMCLALLCACAQSSGVMKLGPNTYSIVTTDELGGTIASKRAGLEEGAAFCAGIGQEMAVMQSQSDVRTDFVGDPVAHHDLTFSCVRVGSSSQRIVGGSPDALIVR